MKVVRQPHEPSGRIKRARAVNTYYSLEKHLIDESGALELAEFRRRFDPKDSVHHNSIAGWMLAEAALVGTNLDKSLRHDLLDDARKDWGRALEIESSSQKSKELQSIALMTPEEIRLQSTLAASNVIDSLIDDDLDRTTREEYYEKLLYLGVKASEGYEYFEDINLVNQYTGGPVREYIGVAHETNAMLILARLKTPSLTCIPALPRSDSGKHYPRKTHDLQALNTKWGDIRSTLGIEVKTTPREEHFERYDAVLIGGTLHLHPGNLRDPSYLAELLVKEYKDILSDNERVSLDVITSNVVHSIRHGFRDTPQCRSVTQCHEFDDHLRSANLPVAPQAY